MEHTSIVEDRLRFLQITEEVTAELRRARNYIEPELDDMLARFYEHILAEPELEALFVDEASTERARNAQKSHWLNRLLEGRFDGQYFEDAERIGRSHAKVGLAPNWYIGGYAYMLAQFVRRITEQARSEDRNPDATVDAVCKAVLLDIDLVIHCYLEAKNESMRSTLRRATEFAADIAALNEQLSTAIDNVETACAELAPDQPASAGQRQGLATAVAALNQTSNELSQRIGDLQFHDKLYIEDSPADRGSFARLKALFRNR